jgi:uncharacterized protein (UPF0332 family)
MMVKTLTGANDSPEIREQLVHKALQVSLGHLNGCVLMIERNEAVMANDHLYYALFHAAKAALFARGKDPSTHQGVKMELSGIAAENKLDREFIRFYGNRERLRSEMSYSYLGEVETFSVQEVTDALKDSYSWMKTLVDELIRPLIPSVPEFDELARSSEIGNHLLDDKGF